MCDICLTTLERNMSETDTQRINTLENSIGTVKDQLLEIKKMLTPKKSAVTPDESAPNFYQMQTQSGSIKRSWKL